LRLKKRKYEHTKSGCQNLSHKGIKMNTLSLGPVGGKGGQTFDDYVIPAGSRIAEVRIYCGDFIDAIQLVYIDSSSRKVVMDKVGGAGGDLVTFTLATDEVITGISGRHGWYIDSLTLHTNKRVSESIGGHYGHEPYELLAPEGRCVTGFSGRCQLYIDAIGIITAPCSHQSASAGSDGGKSLQKIAGLGSKAAAVLIEEGIHNVETLAKTSVKRLEEIFKKAGGRLASTKVASWPEQAAHAAKKDWKALKAMQEKLKKKK